MILFNQDSLICMVTVKAHKDKGVKNFLDSGNLMYYCHGIELVSSYQAPGFYQF